MILIRKIVTKSLVSWLAAIYMDPTTSHAGEMACEEGERGEK